MHNQSHYEAHADAFFKNLSIQGLVEYISQLVTGLGIVQLDSPQVDLLLSQVV